MQAARRLQSRLYKWLPIIMGCHCRADRSFHFRGRPFPVCARCTGMLLGFLASIATLWWKHPGPLWLLLMALPMIIDGVVQRATKYESTNLRRLFTGLFGGYALMSLLLLSFVWTFRLGRQLGFKLGLAPKRG